MRSRDLKKFAAFLKDPPVWFIIAWFIFALAAIGASIAAVALTIDAPWVYAVYAVAALALAYAIYILVKCAPKVKAAAVRQLEKHRFTGAFLHDYGFRTTAVALAASIINAAYVAVNGASAIIYGSVWYWAMTGYYFALMLVRAGVLYADRRVRRLTSVPNADGGLQNTDDKRQTERGKLKIYLGCGIALLVLEVALVAAVARLVTDEQHARTGMILSICLAAYSFYKLTLAIINMFRAKRYSDPAVQCFRNINLVDALVSMLSLEVTLIATNGGAMPWLTAISGAVVSLFNIVVGVIMIVQAASRLKKEQR